MLETFLASLPPFTLNAFWISQGLIGIAFISDLISYQMKKREHVLVFFTISSLLIGAHLQLLEQPTAAILLYLGAFRFFISIFTTHKALLYGVLATSTLLVWIFYTGPLDVLAWICNMLFTIAAFSKTDKRLRQVMMCGTSLWIGYQILVFSPAGVMLETFFLGSNLIGYWRFYIRKPLN